MIATVMEHVVALMLWTILGIGFLFTFYEFLKTIIECMVCMLDLPAKWVPYDRYPGFFYCSRCEFVSRRKYKICPYCGSRMKEE